MQDTPLRATSNNNNKKAEILPSWTEYSSGNFINLTIHSTNIH